MEKKALFLDMDGTTLNDQVEIPKENLEAMKAALKAGHEIIVTTDGLRQAHESCWNSGDWIRSAAVM